MALLGVMRLDIGLRDDSAGFFQELMASADKSSIG
jgi:hypothetical protein